MGTRRPMFCSVCEVADEQDVCPCNDIVTVRQTSLLTYGDGSTQPYTTLAVLCFECRLSFYSYGDLIVAVA